MHRNKYAQQLCSLSLSEMNKITPEIRTVFYFCSADWPISLLLRAAFDFISCEKRRQWLTKTTSLLFQHSVKMSAPMKSKSFELQNKTNQYNANCLEYVSCCVRAYLILCFFKNFILFFNILLEHLLSFRPSFYVWDLFRLCPQA